MNTALPFSSADSCPAPGGGGREVCDTTPVPNGGAYAPLPYARADLCEPVPIPRYGGECVGEAVMVLLPDGRTCEARNLKTGDTILGLDPQGVARPQQVTSVSFSVQSSLQIVAADFQIVCSKSHLLMTSVADRTRADELSLGSQLLTGEGSKVEVSQIVELGKLPVVNLVCEPDHTYIAAGLLNHNKIAIPVSEIDE